MPVILISLLLILYAVADKENSIWSTAVFLVSALIISGSKSQFFYVPVLLLPFAWYFRNYKRIIIVTLLIMLALSITMVFNSKEAASHNRFHSYYYGILLWEKINEKPLPKDVDQNCVGIDVWGNKFDMTHGAVPSGLGSSCYDTHKTVPLSRILREFLRYPWVFIALPFDTGARYMYTTDYNHVYKKIKYIVDQPRSWPSYITQAKDTVYQFARVPLAIVIFILSTFVTGSRRNFLCSNLFLLGFLISQFCVCFLGEGYRDLSKHLFAMTFSFDLLLFVSLILLYKKYAPSETNALQGTPKIG